MNVFEAVKQSVTTRQAAEHYGIRVNRNGMACCPFHNDKTPSMKLDKRFHCFGCGADGDVIDFVAALYGLGKKEAAAQLASDFGLAYEDWKPPGRARKPKPRQKSPEEQFREAKAHCFRVLADYLHLLRVWKTDYAPHSPEEAFHPRFVEALQKQAHVEYLLDVLLFGAYDLKTKTTTQILENVYYPIIKNHVIYYQLDQDHESLYRYSLDDQTNQKLNDETSYDITIDGKYIYYLAKNDEQYALKRMTITGENIETLYEKQCTFALDNKDLYLTDNSQIIKINKETLKQETIKKVENRAIALVNNKIVYATGTQLKMMSLNGKDDQILFKNIVVSDLQVLGSDLFTKGYVQESGVKYIVFNIKGQYKALNENTAQEFENLQDA